MLDKGFIGTIARLTLENINDCDFCRDSSYLLYVTSESLESDSQAIEFFIEIKEFGLITALLENHGSDDIICFNTLNVLNRVVIGFQELIASGCSFKPLFESGLIETIGSIMEKSRDDSVIKFCRIFFKTVADRSNTSSNNY